MPRKLVNTKDTIDRFIYEAEQCAKQELGFAAMLTIFPVMLSISEAVAKHTGKLSISDSNDLPLFQEFVPYMTDKTWLRSRKKVSLSDNDIAEELYHLRNALTHELSEPNYIGLINTEPEVKEFLKENPKVTRAVCVVEFVEAVKVTVEMLVKKYSHADLDLNPKIPRSPAKRVILPLSGTSGSPADS